MMNLKGNVIDIGFGPRHAIANLQTDSFASKSIHIDTNVDDEDPFVMGRSLLVFVVIELIIGFGLYRYFQ